MVRSVSSTSVDSPPQRRLRVYVAKAIELPLDIVFMRVAKRSSANQFYQKYATASFKVFDIQMQLTCICTRYIYSI